MGLISLLWGIVAICWMVLALIPLIGITNWLLIPFAAIGAVIAAVGILFTSSERRGRAKAGLILNGIVVVVAATGTEKLKKPPKLEAASLAIGLPYATIR